MGWFGSLVKKGVKLAAPIVGGALGGPLGASLASAGTSLLGGSKQAKGARQGAGINMDMFGTLSGMQQPFLQAGYGANAKLGNLLGISGDPNSEGFGSFAKPFTIEDFYANKDPGYEFQKQQGEQSLRNAAGAGSGALSGAALKDLLKYNQDYASTAYEGAFNRYQTQQGNIFSRLGSLLGVGQNAATGITNAGADLAGNAGQLTANAGAATGAGIVGAGNAVNDGLMYQWLLKNLPGLSGAGTTKTGGWGGAVGDT